MAHTLPPWTSKWKLVKIFGQIDSGELAARLGAASTEDRRGNIIWMDNFEDIATKWITITSGTGASSALSAAHAWMGSSSWKLVTGNTTGNYAIIYRPFTQPSNEKIGVEIKFRIKGGGMYMEILGLGYDGTKYYSAGLRFVGTGTKLEYYDENGAWQTIASGVLDATLDEMWIMMKLVFDWSAKKYVRGLIGNDEYDLSEYNIKAAASAERKHMRIHLNLEATVDSNITAYVDNFILTQNEP